MVVLIIVIIVVVLIALGLWAAFNGLVKKRNRTQEAWSEIDVELKRRHDLIPNLVSTVQGYAAHERETFEAVTKARAGAVTAGATGDPSQIAPAENALSGALRSLFAVAENYPQLRAVESFLQLQETLTATEDKIEYARRYYNTSARDYDIALQTFPAQPDRRALRLQGGGVLRHRRGRPRCARGEVLRFRASGGRPRELGTPTRCRCRRPAARRDARRVAAEQLRSFGRGIAPCRSDGLTRGDLLEFSDPLLDGGVGVVEAVIPGLVVLQRVVDAHGGRGMV